MQVHAVVTESILAHPAQRLIQLLGRSVIGRGSQIDPQRPGVFPVSSGSLQQRTPNAESTVGSCDEQVI